MMSKPDVTIDLTVEIDHGQLYIYSVAPWAHDQQNDAVERALRDARQSGRWVGVADGLVDLVVPFRKSFDAPMRVEMWPEPVPPDDDNWDHVVDIDFDIVNGDLVFEPSGGFEAIRCEEPLPRGAYRARISGRGYTEAASGAVGMDSYRIRLWPRTAPTPPELRKSWPGWSAQA
ncbi:hypothetical protein [Kutzneria albida]|uniref:Uncharacterized protein n=1 Tax=Kutzneria albida DSM 43870 TaxID=1449976 RepID=W5WBU0_9PSEU|nr:hypothetical protein [Kutzneria albida]AHH98618.1 hypothetical protein KALB_5256 [Kutzneria albida DSM 43870]